MYFIFGVSHIGPRILQLLFYILGGLYLYRTILLFHKKDVALLGTTIYLFSPVVFRYASTAALASGEVFFMIVISYYFLRFLKDEDERDLLLTAFFIGTGFMYRRVLLVMFIICFVYLIFSRIIKREWHSIIHFKVLLLSLVAILPFYIIGKIGVNYYVPVYSNLLSFESMFMVIRSQLSTIISLLLLSSIIYILFMKRDNLSLFYSFYFIAFYVFFTLQMGIAVNRYSVAFYPAIAVLLAQFVYDITQNIRSKHVFKMAYTVISVYLIFLCMVPRTYSNLTTFQYKDFEMQYYPIDKAVDWIRDMTDKEDKILVLYFASDIRMYVERLYEYSDDIKDRVMFQSFGSREPFASSEQLKQYCIAEKISYVMLPYSPKNEMPKFGLLQEREENKNRLKEDMGKNFLEIKKFNRYDNYILIYKLRGNHNGLK